MTAQPGLFAIDDVVSGLNLRLKSCDQQTRQMG